jgi:DNA anti-recombination protein RmuC
MNMSQFFADWQAFRSGELVSLEQFNAAQSRIAELEAKETDEAIQARVVELESANAELIEQNEQLATSLSAQANDISERDARIAELEANDQSATEQAAEIVAELGVPAEELPAEEAEASAPSPEQIQAEFAKMQPGKDRSEFFQKHRKALLG